MPPIDAVTIVPFRQPPLISLMVKTYNMERETIKKKQRKSLIKKVLIGVGLVGSSVLVIRALMHGKQKNIEYRKMRIAYEPAVQAVCLGAPTPKLKHKPKYNDDSIIKECNQLLRSLWERRNPDDKLYYDDEMCIDIKDCPFPPFIAHRED